MDCIACGSTNNPTDLVFYGGYPRYYGLIARNKFFPGVDIKQCDTCGLVQPYPLPSQAAVDAFYREDYYRYNPVERWFKKRIGTLFARSRKSWIDRFVTLIDERNILEIGCGYGNLLALFAKEYGGFNCDGVEPSEECFQHNILGRYSITQCEIEDFDTSVKYDLIILSHVLEHMVDPAAAIEKLKSLLVPGGVLWLEVPNRHAPTYKKNNYRNVPDFYFFDRDSFEMFLKNHGLTGQVFNLETRALWGRFDKVGCAVNYLWFEALNLCGKSLLYRGKNDSFGICAIVRAR